MVTHGLEQKHSVHTHLRESAIGAEEAKEDPIGKPTLIIVPPTLVYQWVDEIQRVTPKIKVYVYYRHYGNTRSRVCGAYR